MKWNRQWVLVLGLGLATAACDDDFLSTVPPDELSDAVFWTQERDAVFAVNALYPLNLGWEVTRFDAGSDNAWAQKSFDAWYGVGNGTIDATSGVPSFFWNTSYTAIRRANTILANIDRIPNLNAGLRDRLVAQTRFMRAYHYNYLINLFGDVPLILDPISIEDARQIARTPKAQVYQQIVQDLDFAAGALPTSYADNEYGRVTRGAALALKARAALYQSQWQVAAEAAKAVMDLNVYELHPTYAQLTRYAGNGSKEAIFVDRRMKGQRAHSAFASLAPRSLEGGSDVVPLRSLVDAYQMIDGRGISDSPLFDSANPYANRDPRMYATLLYPGAQFAGAVFNSLPSSTTPDRVGNDFNATSTGFQTIKYVDPADRGDQRNNSAIDFILLRYADVLLMYAEARIEQNQIDGTVTNAINAVRTRAGMPVISGGLSQAELRNVVRHERRVELALEGLRLFDIRRWQIAAQVMPGQQHGIDYIDNGVRRTIPADVRRFEAGRDYLWPIPQRERELNPSLTQNPGY